jgi:pimeloyl-ACP methyl ester carboxylesterase
MVRHVLWRIEAGASQLARPLLWLFAKGPHMTVTSPSILLLSRTSGASRRALDALCGAAAIGACLLGCSDDDVRSPSQAVSGVLPLVDGGVNEPSPPRLADDVILVHGAWADGSSWTEVIPLLQDVGLGVQAVQLPEISVATDAALVRHAIEVLGRPVVVVGHSYGGYVISEASAGLSNVAGLVYVAAFAPDEGETIGALAAGFPPTPAIQSLVIDDQGNAIIEPGAFVRYFASDVPERQAKVLAAVQKPTAASILGTPAGPPGWKTFPTFYQVSTNDEVIAPDLLRFFAERMGAETIEIDSSHVSLISHPREVADLILRASELR